MKFQTMKFPNVLFHQFHKPLLPYFLTHILFAITVMHGRHLDHLDDQFDQNHSAVVYKGWVACARIDTTMKSQLGR